MRILWTVWKPVHRFNLLTLCCPTSTFDLQAQVVSPPFSLSSAPPPLAVCRCLIHILDLNLHPPGDSASPPLSLFPCAHAVLVSLFSVCLFPLSCLRECSGLCNLCVCVQCPLSVTSRWRGGPVARVARPPESIFFILKLFKSLDSPATKAWFCKVRGLLFIFSCL